MPLIGEPEERVPTEVLLVLQGSFGVSQKFPEMERVGPGRFRFKGRVSGTLIHKPGGGWNLTLKPEAFTIGKGSEWASVQHAARETLKTIP